MVEIIKHGTKLRQYTCPDCGCVFYTNEYWNVCGNGQEHRVTQCPECHIAIDVGEEDSKEWS